MMHTPRFPIDFLVSYHYFQRDTDMSTRAQPHLRLIADSGAFSAFTQGARIDIDAYAAWIKRWQGHLSYIHRYATIPLYSTHTRTVHTLDMKKGVPHQHRHLLSQEYATTPQALHPVGKHNWGLLETLTVLSTQRRAKRLQAIHQVTPPRWGINPQARPLRGPRIHLVQRDSRSLKHLNPKQGAA